MSSLKGQDRVDGDSDVSGEIRKADQKNSNCKVKKLVATIEADTKPVDTSIANDSNRDEKTSNVEVTDEKAPDNTCTGDDGPYMSSQGSCP
jgi:hypothetical protein